MLPLVVCLSHEQDAESSEDTWHDGEHPKVTRIVRKGPGDRFYKNCGLGARMHSWARIFEVLMWEPN